MGGAKVSEEVASDGGAGGGEVNTAALSENLQQRIVSAGDEILQRDSAGNVKQQNKKGCADDSGHGNPKAGGDGTELREHITTGESFTTSPGSSDTHHMQLVFDHEKPIRDNVHSPDDGGEMKLLRRTPTATQSDLKANAMPVRKAQSNTTGDLMKPPVPKRSLDVSITYSHSLCSTQLMLSFRDW